MSRPCLRPLIIESKKPLKTGAESRFRAKLDAHDNPTITLIIGPQKPVFYSENLPGLPGSCDDSDEFVDGPDRLLGVSALGGRRPFLGGEIMESRREEAIRLAGVRVFGPSGAVQPRPC